LELLPIDIHYNKLLDWLSNRRHTTHQCQAILTSVRDKQVAARQHTHDEGLATGEVEKLLTIPQLNFFQVRQLADILKSTGAGKTNLIGQYTSQCMKDWSEILKLYEKDGTYLVESANGLTRNVNYEVPALRKQITKCQQTQKECTRKEAECLSSAAELRKQYATSCQQIGIEGLKIKTELAGLVKDLPQELSKLAESAQCLNDAVQFYDNFTQFLLNKESLSESSLPVLKHLMTHGNTTTFEWRTGKTPSQVEEQGIKIDLSDELDVGAEAEDIDWGAIDGADAIDFGDSIDFDLGDITVESGGVLAAAGEVVLENPDIDTIDWGAVEDVSPTPDACAAGDTATGKDALSVIDNPETRNLFVDDLLELKAFLTQRTTEMSQHSTDSAHFASAPSNLHLDTDQVAVMITKVKDILDKLTSVQMQHLLLIRDSPRYVDRLRDSLKQKLVSADKMALTERETAAVRRVAEEEEEALKPQLEVLKKQTKVLKNQLQEEISKKYNERKVNIIGEINTL